MRKPTTPAQYILILIDLVESQGYARERLLANTSLAQSGISGIGARVDDMDFQQLVHNALDITGDPALGIKLGQRLNLSSHAILGQTFMTCRDLRQVLQLFLKYYHLLSDSLELEHSLEGERWVLTTISNPPTEFAPEFGFELTYTAIVNTLCGLLNRSDLGPRVELPYSPPPHAALYYESFGEDVHFNCRAGRISFHTDLLDTPLPSSNPALLNLYEEECARLLADMEEEDSVAEQTLRLLRKLEGQYPQMPQIARMLNFSPRTYRRRLESEQQSFQALLDQVRSEHATRYLQNTKLPLSTIAYMVGFNDASNFRRAYTKWTGSTPRQIRNGL
jgi:AraC-like DNA-binding protein